MTVLFKFLSYQFASVLIILGIVGLVTAQRSSVKPLPAGYIYHPEVRSSYKLNTIELSWSNARMACLRDGASLAIIDTSEKIGFLSSQRQWGSYIWTGISRDGFLSPWVADDGSDVATHLPWGFLGSTPGMGNCVALSGLTSGLCNLPCSLRYSYVCEIRGQR